MEDEFGIWFVQLSKMMKRPSSESMLGNARVGGKEKIEKKCLTWKVREKTT